MAPRLCSWATRVGVGQFIEIERTRKTRWEVTWAQAESQGFFLRHKKNKNKKCSCRVKRLVICSVSVSHSAVSDSATMNCSPLGSSFHGIFQARILEWVAITLSRGSSWPRDWTWVSCIVGRFLLPSEPATLPLACKPLAFHPGGRSILPHPPSPPLPSSVQSFLHFSLILSWCCFFPHLQMLIPP